MKGVRFTKAERAVIKELVTEWMAGNDSKTGTSIIDKLEAAELPVKKSGLTVSDAIAAFREVLGARLVAPPFTAVGVLSQMKNRIAALGLTRGQCTTIAKVAAAEWRGPVKAESLCRQADTLLAASQQDFKFYNEPPRSPVELDDDEI